MIIFQQKKVGNKANKVKEASLRVVVRIHQVDHLTIHLIIQVAKAKDKIEDEKNQGMLLKIKNNRKTVRKDGNKVTKLRKKSAKRKETKVNKKNLKIVEIKGDLPNKRNFQKIKMT